MFALQSAQKNSSDAETAPAANSYTPNILPCRIHHDGPVETLKRYWNPVADENGKITSREFIHCNYKFFRTYPSGLGSLTAKHRKYPDSALPRP